MSFEELLKDLTLDDLSDKQRQAAEVIGIEGFIKLSQNLGGIAINIPLQYELVKKVKYRKILEEFDGGDLQELAIKYRTSSSTVYRIVKEKLEKKKAAPMEGQISLL